MLPETDSAAVVVLLRGARLAVWLCGGECAGVLVGRRVI